MGLLPEKIPEDEDEGFPWFTAFLLVLAVLFVVWLYAPWTWLT